MDEPNRSGLDKQIQDLEETIMITRQKLAELRSQKEPEVIGAYTLKNWDGQDVPLADLFGDKKDLILVHNMGTSCSYCTLWADGFMGFQKHFENRAAFVVETPNSIDVQKEFAASRGWEFTMVSSEGSKFRHDMGFVGEKGGMWPGVSVFHKTDDGQVVRVNRADFGPGDDYCSLWSLFGLLKGGAGDWAPKFKYE